MRLKSWVLACLMLIPSIAQAEDAYFDVAISELKITGELPAPAQDSGWRSWQKRAAMSPRASVKDGEGFVVMDDTERTHMAMADTVSSARLVLKAPAGKDVSGMLIVAKSDLSGMTTLPFTIPAASASADAKKAYLHGVVGYFNGQLFESRAGAAYFRHRVNAAHEELGEKEDPNANWRPNRVDDLDGTLDLFTGTRAIAENLQLDRMVNVPKTGEDSVDISSIRGITVAEADFKSMLKDAKPAVDPLAKWIPADQHSVFFPNFEAFQAVMNASGDISLAAIRTFDSRTEEFSVKSRYEKQMGLELTTLSKIIGPAMVSSVAITGGDPYVEAGTDIAVLFEAKDPPALRAMLQGKLTFSNLMQAKAETIDGIECAVFRDDVKGIRSYLATLDDAVIVTNSPAQIKAIAAVKSKSVPPLSEATDYLFFRNRYALGDKDESAFVMLSDATIRRWCGPKWRIADSRRARALAKLLDDRCEKAASIIKGEDQVTTGSEYGSADFLTPIGELDISKVSVEEKDAYERWRQQYQNNWRGFFDPILPARLTVKDDKLAMDLSIMPLIAGTDYRQIIDLTQGVKILPNSGDPHGALGHLIVAINAKSGLMRTADTFAMSFAPKAGVNPLGWIGPTVSIYAEDDPMWDALAKKKEDDVEKYLKEKGYALPMAVFVESTSPLKLAAFMTAAPAFVEQSAPNMTLWETKQKGELAYVRVSASEGAKADMHDVDNVSLYYATTGKGLVLSLNEATLVKALERLSAKQADKPATTPWAGESLALKLSPGWLRAFELTLNGSFTDEVQRRAWSNLSILNEWKRLYPDQDPIKVHEKLFGCTLISPGGGTYSWNEQFQTMQSSVFGHPGEPKSSDQKIELFKILQGIDAGVTFENQGLRGKVEIKR